jgi:serralysin
MTFYPGTSLNDTFHIQAGDSANGQAGNDTFLLTGISSSTVRTTLDGGADADTLDASNVFVGFEIMFFTDDYSDTGSFNVGSFHVRGVETIYGSLLGGNYFTLQNAQSGLTLYGANYADVFTGSFDYADTFAGFGGNDTFNIRYGDVALGGGDNDSFVFYATGYGYADGGSGTDTLVLAFGWTADLAAGAAHGPLAGPTSTLVSIENIQITAMSGYASSAYGDDGANVIEVTTDAFEDDGRAGVVFDGRGGADTLIGSHGADSLSGGDGDDIIAGGAGADTINGGAGNDVLIGGAGADTLVGDTGLDLASYSDATQSVTINLTTGVYTGDAAGDSFSGIEGFVLSTKNDYFVGDSGANIVFGGGGADVLEGRGGNDTFFGDASAPITIYGGTGDDWFYVYNGGDSIVEAAGEGNDRILASVSFTLSAGQEVEWLAAADPATTTAINLTGNALAQVIGGNAGANVLISGGGADYLVGFGGDDVLVGNADTASTLQGGTGNDWYYISRTGDSLVEFAGEGNDRILTSVSYTLSAGQEIETLSAVDPAATTAIDLTGNALAQVINGNAGANVLAGGGGSDYLVGLGGDDILVGNADTASTLQGGTGNDWYYISRTGDSLVEFAGEGNDRILTSVSYTLSAGQEIETLSAVDPAATTAISLTGNALGQVINGNAGANVLTGGGGSDYLVGLGGDDILVGNADANSTLQGGAGNDWYYISRTGDSLVEFAGEGDDRILTSVSYTLSAGQEIETLMGVDPAGTAAIDLAGNGFGQFIQGTNGANVLFGDAGADILAGLGGSDTLGGGDGDDQLNGGAGNDVLTGGTGADQFVFADALGSGNVDLVQDFVSGTDRLLLEHGIFTGLSAGALAPGAFVTGTTAQDADDRILYDATTGNLYYDADGNGAGAAILFATLSGHPALTASDVTVI